MYTHTHTSRRFALLLFMFFNAFGVMRASGQCTLCSGTASGTGAVSVGSSVHGTDAGGLGSAAIVGSSGTPVTEGFAIGHVNISANQGYGFAYKGAVSGTEGFALGHRVYATGTGSYVFGRGSDGILTNSQTNSMMFGMNSTLPTMTITDSQGAGNWGNVGIGTSAPVATLHVHAMNGTSQLARYTVSGKSGSLTMTDPEATYYRPTISGISANGNVSALHLMANVLAADDDVADTKPMMVFESKRYSSGANIVNRPLFEWRNNQTARMTMLANGNLGIGTATPAQLLHLDATSGDTRLLIEKGSTNSGLIDFYQNTTHQASIGLDPVEDLIIENYGSNEDIVFSVNDGGTQTDVMTIDGGTSRVGIGTNSPGYKLDVQGGSSININTNGTIQANGTVYPSDQNFKTNVEEIPNALSVIDRLIPRTYFYDTITFNGEGKFSFESKRQYGFIAQQVDTVLPELITHSIKPAIVDTSGNVLLDSYSYMALNYTAIIPFLTKGIQELKLKNDSLRSQLSETQEVNNALQAQIGQLMANDAQRQEQLNELTERVNACCIAPVGSFRLGQWNYDMRSENVTETILSEAPSIVLEQNVPNPWNERTTIHFEVPNEASKAQIMFYNAQGKLIQSVDISTRGTGSLNVFAHDLSTGTYTYMLLIDGKVKATRKMILSK